MARKDLQIDAAIAVAVFAGSLGLLAVGETDGGGIEALAVLLTALASLPLVWGRRAPLADNPGRALASKSMRANVLWQRAARRRLPPPQCFDFAGGAASFGRGR